MHIENLKVALFSGNYNYLRDGANQALNILVEYLLNQGANVRIYSPTTRTPAFEHKGDLVSIPSLAIPGRAEYQFPLAITPHIKRDLRKFSPNIIHTSSPDLVGHRAVTWARKNKLPILSSVHTRFDTYARYYGMAFLEPIMIRLLRRYYRRCNAIVAPSESMIKILRNQNMHADISLWSRGVDRNIFDPCKRSTEWRQSLGIDDDEVVIGFLGRLVMEKGLDIFTQTIAALRNKGHKYKLLIIGDGPARNWFAQKLPDAVFIGFQNGQNLGRAVASMDILFNPSITETFGNVTLEAMASGIPVVAARASGSISLIQDGKTGLLATPGSSIEFAQKLEYYMQNINIRKHHGQAGEIVSRNYGWDQINQKMVEIYLRILSERPKN